MSRRSAATPAMSFPDTRTTPASGAVKPAMMRRIVVLPEPEGPSSAWNSPAGTSKATSWSTGVSP